MSGGRGRFNVRDENKLSHEQRETPTGMRNTITPIEDEDDTRETEAEKQQREQQGQ